LLEFTDMLHVWMHLYALLAPVSRTQLITSMGSKQTTCLH